MYLFGTSIQIHTQTHYSQNLLDRYTDKCALSADLHNVESYRETLYIEVLYLKNVLMINNRQREVLTHKFRSQVQLLFLIGKMADMRLLLVFSSFGFIEDLWLVRDLSDQVNLYGGFLSLDLIAYSLNRQFISCSSCSLVVR